MVFKCCNASDQQCSLPWPGEKAIVNNFFLYLSVLLFFVPY